MPQGFQLSQTWEFAFNVGKDFALGNSLFVAVKLGGNSDPDKYIYSSYDSGFDTHGSFLLPVGCWFSKNVIIFDASMSSLVHIDNKKRYLDSWQMFKIWFRWY